MLHFLKKNKEKHLQISLSKSRWYDLQFLRYRAKHNEIGNFKSFLPYYPTKNPKNQNFEKWKKLLAISFYTCVPKIIIIWCVVLEIRSETDRIFCHFGPFFALLQPPLMIQKIKILKKNEKNVWRYYPFIQTCVP